MKRLFRFSTGRAGAARDVRDELRFHIETRAKEFMAQGMSAEDARGAAERAFGDYASIESEVRSDRVAYVERNQRRDRWGGLQMDLMYALRALRKNPGFTAAAVATLALGIGATVAVFTVVNGVLMRPLPYHDPSRLAMIWLRDTREGGRMPLSAGFAALIQQDSTLFASIAAFRSWPYTVAGDGAAEQVAGARVNPSFFATLGATPLLGRVFPDSGDIQLVMLSYGYWQRRFGGDRNIVGQRIILSGEAFTVTGVMPKDFAFPRGAELPPGLQFGARTDVWTPMILTEEERRVFGTMNMSAVGRLRPGVTHEQAATRMSAGMREWLTEQNARAQLAYAVVTLKEQAGERIRRSLLVLMGAVGFVLLIACANVANLLIGRTTGRQREFAVRAALGAGRGRIARQLVTENITLAGVGAALGLGLSVGLVRLMLSMMPSSLPRADDVTVDWRVTALAAGVAIIAGSVFGIATAFHIRRADLAGALQNAAGRVTKGRRARVGRRLLVVSEISMSLVLLIGAIQLTQSFVKLQHVDPGFAPHGVITARVLSPVVGGFNVARDGPKWEALFTGLSDRLRSAPGVASVGAISGLPLTNRDEFSRVTVIGRPVTPNAEPLSTMYSVVSGDYFDAMRMPLINGRVFDGTDRGDGQPVIVVNKTFAARYFPGESPVGQQVRGGFEFVRPAPPRLIVGVVDDVRQSGLSTDVVPQVYVPITQMPYPGMAVVIRASQGDPHALLPALSRELRALDPNAGISDVRLLEEVVEQSLARQRFSTTIIGIFAAVSLLLAMVGLYSVVALGVRQRRREFGVRMALGAAGKNVIGLVLGEGAWVIAAGLLLGVVGAVALNEVLTSMLFEASALDVRVFVASALGVAAVSLLATYVPARRAIRVHPTEALRSE